MDHCFSLRHCYFELEETVFTTNRHHLEKVLFVKYLGLSYLKMDYHFFKAENYSKFYDCFEFSLLQVRSSILMAIMIQPC